MGIEPDDPDDFYGDRYTTPVTIFGPLFWIGVVLVVLVGAYLGLR